MTDCARPCTNESQVQAEELRDWIKGAAMDVEAKELLLRTLFDAGPDDVNHTARAAAICAELAALRQTILFSRAPRDGVIMNAPEATVPHTGIAKEL